MGALNLYVWSCFGQHRDGVAVALATNEDDARDTVSRAYVKADPVLHDSWDIEWGVLSVYPATDGLALMALGGFTQKEVTCV